jgi:hypothetical protein
MHAVAGACRWPAARAAYGPPRDTRLRSTELRQFSRTERLRLCASHGNKGEGRQSGDRGSEQHVQSILQRRLNSGAAAPSARCSSDRLCAATGGREKNHLHNRTPEYRSSSLGVGVDGGS